MSPMSTAPKDRVIVVKARGVGWRRAYFLDCQWLREDDEHAEGDPSIADCWRIDDGNGNDIEIPDAIGWRPAR